MYIALYYPVGNSKIESNHIRKPYLPKYCETHTFPITFYFLYSYSKYNI